MEIVMKRPHILITNDDGIHAPGIAHLWNALKGIADISICAPAREQSGAGLGISLHFALEINQVSWPENTPAWSVSGKPADCVKMALSLLLKNKPDLIVSGINPGGNHGRSLLYSGTVGGVIEGILRGIPGIAFSCYDLEQPEFARFEQYVPKIVEYVLQNPLPNGTLLNVTFPSARDHVEGQEYAIKLTRQGKQYWLEDPQTNCGKMYTLGARLMEFDEHEESDALWLQKNCITAAPVHVDELTDLRYLDAHKDKFERLFAKEEKIIAK